MKKIRILISIFALIFSLVMIIGQSFAFFTDTEIQTYSGTQGSINVDTKLVLENPTTFTEETSAMLYPGKLYRLNHAWENKSNFSADLKFTITVHCISSNNSGYCFYDQSATNPICDIELYEDSSCSQPLLYGEDNRTISYEKLDDTTYDTKITYVVEKLANGIIQKEKSADSISGNLYYYLYYNENPYGASLDSFYGNMVYITVVTEAKQHRNTGFAGVSDWVTLSTKNLNLDKFGSEMPTVTEKWVIPDDFIIGEEGAAVLNPAYKYKWDKVETLTISRSLNFQESILQDLPNLKTLIVNSNDAMKSVVNDRLNEQLELNGLANLQNVEKIVITDSVTEISYKAFYNCRSFKEVNIPDSVASIGDLAFYSCSSLDHIVIPDSVTEIGVSAFANTALTEVSIPSGCTYQSNSFPSGCTVTVRS